MDHPKLAQARPTAVGQTVTGSMKRVIPAPASIWIITERIDAFSSMLGSLRSELFDARVVADGWKAYYEAMMLPPSVLLVDGALKCMDAIAFCCLMKGSEWVAHIPLIFIDVEGESCTRVRALSSGASDCITFPFLPEELVARLCIQRSRARRFRQEASSGMRVLDDLTGDGCAKSALELIKGGDVGRLNVKSISRHVGANNRRLGTQFKATLGVTVSSYLRAERMERAAWLLRNTGITVSAVAKEVGFRSPCNFSVAFKRHMGLSPSAYRGADFQHVESRSAKNNY